MDRFILIIVWLNIFAAHLTARGNFTLRAVRFDHQATHANEITGGLIPNNCVEIIGQRPINSNSPWAVRW
jgi:hypothetical protein